VGNPARQTELRNYLIQEHDSPNGEKIKMKIKKK
jgi:hypothetical protein